jgi:hypothetical protein
MAMFKAFKPSGMEKIARAMGYQGNMQGFQNYLAQDPMRQQQMQNYQQKAMQMAKGGVVKMQQGGATIEGKPLDYYLPGAFPPGNTQYEVNPKYTGGKENVYETIPLPTGNPKAAADAERAMMGPAQNAAGGYNPQTGQFTPLNQLPQGPAGQFAPGNLAQAQNQMQMSGNITGNLADAFDPRGIQPITKPAANTGTVAPAMGNEYIDYFKLPDGSRFSYDRRTRMAIPPGAVGVSQEEFMRLPDRPTQGGLQSVNLLTGELGPDIDYSGMTYEQAQSRMMQADMKSPAEQAAIDAAIARGPVAQTPQTQLPTTGCTYIYNA